MNYRELGLYILAVVTAFALGRSSVHQPEVKSSQQDTKKEVTDENKDTVKKTTIVKNKDGSETTVIDEHTTDKSHDAMTDNSKSSSAVIPQKVGMLNVSALVSIDTQNRWTHSYGASVSKQVLGPISVGLFGLTNGTVGASIGLSF